MRFFPLGTSLKNAENCRSTIVASFQKLCPGIKLRKKDEFIILGSPLGPKSQADLLEKKSMNWKMLTELLKNYMRTMVFLC